MTVTFFGHRDDTLEIQPKSEETIIDLIESYDADTFFVGNNGKFDGIVRDTLKALQLIYPHINYSVVLAHLPKKDEDYENFNYLEMLFPDVLTKTPFRYTIDKRNRWMINKSDCVVTYVKTIIGGAAKYKEIAEKKSKMVINLYQPEAQL